MGSTWLLFFLPFFPPSGHLTLSPVSDLRGGILQLITLTQGFVCTAACQGSWLESGVRSNPVCRVGVRVWSESGGGDNVRGIWVKRTVCGQAGWYVLWAGAGAGGDHPYHMFLGVLQRARLQAQRAQHTQPLALPDAFKFFFHLLRVCRNLHNMPMQTHTRTHTHFQRNSLLISRQH